MRIVTSHVRNFIRYFFQFSVSQETDVDIFVIFNRFLSQLNEFVSINSLRHEVL